MNDNFLKRFLIEWSIYQRKHLRIFI